MAKRILLVVGLCAVVASGCQCGPSSTPAPSRPKLPLDSPLGLADGPKWGDGGIEIGLAQSPDAFEAFPTPFIFDRGPQGGIHVPVGYRVSGHAFVGARFVLRVRRERDGLLVYQDEQTLSASLAADAVQVFPNRALLCPPPEGVSLVAEPLRFEVTVIGPPLDFLGRASAVSSTMETQCQ
jgi:hypothetical protein